MDFARLSVVLNELGTFEDQILRNRRIETVSTSRYISHLYHLPFPLPPPPPPLTVPAYEDDYG